MQIFANDVIVVVEGGGPEGKEGKEMSRNHVTNWKLRQLLRL